MKELSLEFITNDHNATVKVIIEPQVKKTTTMLNYKIPSIIYVKYEVVGIQNGEGQIDLETKILFFDKAIITKNLFSEKEKNCSMVKIPSDIIKQIESYLN